jgi:hypothetical protein
VQARELVRADTIYTTAVEMQEVMHLSYELVLSGSQQITNALMITSIMPFTTVVPLRVFTPLTATEWITIATGLANTQTLFLGNPGSTYEFRVRARDQVGNQQDWYDGYSVHAQVNPNLSIFRTYIPLVMR